MIPIGTMSLERDFPHLISDPDAAWISICIGAETARGKGIAKLAMAFLESEAIAKGFTSIELGVFAFNPIAKRLYDQCGYTEIARVPNFVRYAGQSYDDIRMIKQL